MTSGRVASIHTRLINLARVRGVDANRILERYALERWIYRLSISKRRDSLCLKGALLFDMWFHAPYRPTRDADFLGFVPEEIPEIASLVREVCALELDDGLIFDVSALHVEEIREDAHYGGLRARFQAHLGTGLIPVQIDVGFGDVVTPAMNEVEFPTLLEESPSPRIRVYPRESVVAEKLEAIVKFGMVNSRMKDYYDLLALARESAMETGLLGAAIAATFNRRRTVLPVGLPVGLSEEFATDHLHQQQWQAFLKRNRLSGSTLEAAIEEIGAFLHEPLRIARAGPE